MALKVWPLNAQSMNSENKKQIRLEFLSTLSELMPRKLCLVGFVILALPTLLTGCKSTPSPEDVKAALKKHLNTTVAGETLCLSNIGSSRPCEDVGSEVQNVDVIEIGPSEKETLLTERHDQFGVPSWTTDDITVWPVKVRLKMECHCMFDRKISRTIFTNQEYKMTNAFNDGAWSVREKK